VYLNYLTPLIAGEEECVISRVIIHGNARTTAVGNILSDRNGGSMWWKAITEVQMCLFGAVRVEKLVEIGW
jgi:hypothetical protein